MLVNKLDPMQNRVALRGSVPLDKLPELNAAINETDYKFPQTCMYGINGLYICKVLSENMRNSMFGI